MGYEILKNSGLFHLCFFLHIWFTNHYIFRANVLVGAKIFFQIKASEYLGYLVVDRIISL